MQSRYGDTVTADNPFPGPRPFRSDERPLFFGRTREISDIVTLLSVHRTVLVSAPSGTGKTSLLQAGVVPTAREEGFEVLPIARVRPLGHSSRACTENVNIYAHNVLENWRAANPAAGPEDATNLSEFFDHQPGGFDRQAGRLLVFDQFEELFVVNPDRWRERAGFFREIQAALDADPLLRALILVRDDFLGRLEPFAGLLRDSLRTRYQLYGLSFAGAMEAVAAPLATAGRTFAPGVVERFVENLREVSTGGSGSVPYQGEYVDPVQLQIVCHVFFERLPAEVEEITDDHIDQYAEVTEALGTFYDRAVKAATKVQKRLRERRMRHWCEKELITPSRSRGTVYQGEKTTEGLPNAAVAELEHHRILRSEPRGNALWYELTHDRFIDAVLDSNRKWFARHPRFSRRRLLIVVSLLVIVATVSSFTTKQFISESERAAVRAIELRDPIETQDIEGVIEVSPTEHVIHGEMGQLLTVFDNVKEDPPRLELVGPDGKVLETARGAGRGPVLGTDGLPATGDYSLRVSGTKEQAGRDYGLFAVRHEVDTRQTIQAGTQPGSIHEPNETDIYRFRGHRGALVSIGMTSRFIDPDLILRTPSRMVVDNDSASEETGRPGIRSALLALTLPEDGLYEVRAFASDVGSTGSYKLNLAFPNNREPSVDPLRGRLAAGESAAYAIRAVEGDAVSIRLTPTQGLEANLRLFDPGGVQLAESKNSTMGVVRLAYPTRRNTNYILGVTAVDAVDYSLVLEHLTAKSLVNTAVAELNGPEVKAYRITNQVNTIGVLLLGKRGGDPSLRIVGPDALVTQRQGTESDEGDLMALPLTAPGEYFAFVESTFAEASYSLAFAGIPKAPNQ